MMNKNNSSRNIITKESIFTALMILMEKKNLKEISITEVTKKAGVSRMAFYRNYNLVEDIITNYLDEFFDEYFKEILSNEDMDTYEISCWYFACFRKQEKLIINLINSNLTNLLVERLSKFLLSLSQNITCKKSYSPEIEKYIIEFIVGGFSKVLIEWAMNGMKESDEYMAKILCDFCVLDC